MSAVLNVFGGDYHDVGVWPSRTYQHDQVVSGVSGAGHFEPTAAQPGGGASDSLAGGHVVGGDVGEGEPDGVEGGGLGDVDKVVDGELNFVEHPPGVGAAR